MERISTGAGSRAGEDAALVLAAADGDTASSAILLKMIGRKPQETSNVVIPAKAGIHFDFSPTQSKARWMTSHSAVEMRLPLSRE